LDVNITSSTNQRDLWFLKQWAQLCGIYYFMRHTPKVKLCKNTVSTAGDNKKRGLHWCFLVFDLVELNRFLFFIPATLFVFVFFDIRSKAAEQDGSVNKIKIAWSSSYDSLSTTKDRCKFLSDRETSLRDANFSATNYAELQFWIALRKYSVCRVDEAILSLQNLVSMPELSAFHKAEALRLLGQMELFQLRNPAMAAKTYKQLIEFLNSNNDELLQKIVKDYYCDAFLNGAQALQDSGNLLGAVELRKRFLVLQEQGVGEVYRNYARSARLENARALKKLGKVTEAREEYDLLTAHLLKETNLPPETVSWIYEALNVTDLASTNEAKMSGLRSVWDNKLLGSFYQTFSIGQQLASAYKQCGDTNAYRLILESLCERFMMQKTSGELHQIKRDVYFDSLLKLGGLYAEMNDIVSLQKILEQISIEFGARHAGAVEIARHIDYLEKKNKSESMRRLLVGSLISVWIFISILFLFRTRFKRGKIKG
jgi:tetratricopeptide (TPR) repeat protein